jgi:hypothetical protein
MSAVGTRGFVICGAAACSQPIALTVEPGATKIEATCLDGHKHMYASTDVRRRPGPQRLIGLAALGIGAFGVAASLRSGIPSRILTVVAGACLLGIDLVLPRMIARDRWYRKLLPLWCLVPFALVFVGGASQHYHTRQEAMGEIGTLANEVARQLEKDAPSPAPTITSMLRHWRDVSTCTSKAIYDGTTIKSAVAELTAAHFDKVDEKEEARRFSALARTVANDLSTRAADPGCVQQDADHDTYSSFMLALAIQGLFVFWIPCLLAVAIGKARRSIDGPAARAFAPKAVRRLLQVRDENILGEHRSLFVPRVCFGILLLLGTTYVFAPLGLKTTYMMSLIDQHATPGLPSVTLWATEFAEAPIVIAGFVGFLLYALLTATQRFALDDFDDQALLSLFVRGLIVMLLSLTLSASSSNADISRLFVFIAGVFPVRALEAIAAKVHITLDPDFSSDDAGSFDGLQSLDPTKAFALRAAGIRSTADLAAMNINVIAERVRINPRLLGRIVDRAILLDAAGKPIVDKLETCGIRLATELADLAATLPKNVVDTLGDTGKTLADRLAVDPRVKAVRQWLDSTSDEV